LLAITYLNVFKQQFAIEIIDNHQFTTIIGFLSIIFILSGIIILGTKNRLNKTFVFPMDATILKLIELINTIPKLLLLITIMAIVNRSIWTIIVIIGFLGWTTIAKLTRSETLKIKEMEYITAVKLLGLSDFKIIYKHIFPNIIPPILIYICFGIASSIIAEAGLSFLGLGLPANEVSWGSMLSASREYISSWWLLYFPGLALFLTILSLHKIGEFIRKKYQPQKFQNINSYF
jgi:peptide/nickel transport system permease protein